MSFLQPIALFGIFLALTPIIIHMLNLMRHRRQSWATMRFLFRAKQSSSRFSKLRKWLTLFARVLAVASLVFLLARPMLSEESNFFDLKAKDPEVLMLILDRSLSMERPFLNTSKTLREKGISEFIEFSRFWPDSRIVVMETVFSDATILDKTEMLNDSGMAEFFGPTDTAANLPFTIDRGLSWLQQAEIGHAQIIVVSDFQNSSWQVQENQQLLDKISEEINQREGLWQMKFLKMATGSLPNFTIEGKSIRQENEEILPTLSIKGTFQGKRKIGVELNLNGNPSPSECNFSFPRTTWTPSISLRNQAANGWVNVRIPTDSFPNDNSYFLTYGKSRMLNVGVIANEKDTKKVLTATTQILPNKIILLEENNIKANGLLSSYADLLLAQGNQGVKIIGEIEKFISAGGTMVLFPDQNSQNQNNPLQRWGKLEVSKEEDPFRISEWKRNSGILSNTLNERELPLSFLETRQRMIPEEGKALAFYEDGKTFLSRKTLGSGIIYSFSTLPSKEWSNLSEGFVIVPALLRVIEECISKSKSANLECGSQASRELIDVKSLTGNPFDKPTYKAGVYRNKNQLFAVNRPGLESNTESLRQQDLEETLRNSHINWSVANTGSSTFQKAEIWNLLLILMLLLLLGESFLGIPLSKPKFI
jgi:hypothetical protein